MLKNISLGLIAVGALAANPALAGSRYIQAPVVDVEPIYETVRIAEPREVCWDETITYKEPNPFPALVGGVIGGVIGNQFGGGNGRKALTAAGAIIGATAMDSAARRAAPTRTAVQQRCEIEREFYEEERLSGFRVWYEVAGQRYVTTTRHDPGETIRVRVNVAPAE